MQNTTVTQKFTKMTATSNTDMDLDVSDVKKSNKEKEVLVKQDQDFFQHDTGDVYDGYFEIKKKERSIKMHGSGIYTTAEGDIYTGVWDGDKLGANEETTIVFTDGARYQGSFKDWCYSGQGKYVYPDGSILLCDFVENSPVGNLTMMDPNGHTWLGKAELGYGWLEPVNHYYEILEQTRDSGKAKHRTQHKAQEKGRTSKK